MEFTTSAAAMLPELQALRRRMHAAPEVGLRLPQTQQLVLDALAELPVQITTGRALSSVTAVLRGGGAAQDSGPVVLLRGDMDALPLIEGTGLDYSSGNGAMHACGHDLHVAGLIGAVRLLAERREELPGTVVFMFQPGEEGHGGGRIMVEEGVLDVAGTPPVAAYAIHVDSKTPYGRFVTRPGPVMAGVYALRITVRGTGGHAAAPHLAVDPVPAAAEIILAVQSFAARRIPASEPAVLSIGKLASDSQAGNVLAREVVMDANIRYFSPQVLELVTEDLPALITGIGKAHRCEVEIEFIPSYPATVNDSEETGFLMETLARSRGPEAVAELPEAAMASEDFSYVLQEVPGVLVFLGARPPGLEAEEASPMHSESVVFEDGILADQAAALAELAWQRLCRG